MTGECNGFYLWLRKQRRRDDTVGDLARDAMWDAGFPRDHVSAPTLYQWSRETGVDDAVVAAIVRALREYRRTPTGRRDYNKAVRGRFIGMIEQSSRNARSISPALRSRVMERDGFRCRRCGSGPDDGARLVIDHVTPVSLGGTGAEQNLQTLCETCNQGKADRLPHMHDLRSLL